MLLSIPSQPLDCSVALLWLGIGGFAFDSAGRAAATALTRPPYLSRPAAISVVSNSLRLGIYYDVPLYSYADGTSREVCGSVHVAVELLCDR